jgi:hypothetical protein
MPLFRDPFLLPLISKNKPLSALRTHTTTL